MKGVWPALFLIRSVWIAPYSENSIHMCQGPLSWGREVVVRLRMTKRSVSVCVWSEGKLIKKTVIRHSRHVMLKMFLISVIDFLFELALLNWLMSLLYGVVLNLSHRLHLYLLTQPSSSTPLYPMNINLYYQLTNVYPPKVCSSQTKKQCLFLPPHIFEVWFNQTKEVYGAFRVWRNYQRASL